MCGRNTPQLLTIWSSTSYQEGFTNAWQSVASLGSAWACRRISTQATPDRHRTAGQKNQIEWYSRLHIGAKNLCVPCSLNMSACGAPITKRVRMAAGWTECNPDSTHDLYVHGSRRQKIPRTLSNVVDRNLHQRMVPNICLSTVVTTHAGCVGKLFFCAMF